LPSNPQQAFIRQLQANTLRALRQHSEAGLSEFKLINLLQSSGHLPGDRDSMLQSLSLFRTHFMLFHCLYSLRDRLWIKKLAHIEISPLCISMVSYQPHSEGLAQQDPLREYYLNLNHMNDTTENDLDEMLSKFWCRLNIRGAGYEEKRESALTILEFSDSNTTQDITLKEIKVQYRRLAMKHHPDRGGSNERLAEINGAMDTLTAILK